MVLWPTAQRSRYLENTARGPSSKGSFLGVPKLANLTGVYPGCGAEQLRRVT